MRDIIKLNSCNRMGLSLKITVVRSVLPRYVVCRLSSTFAFALPHFVTGSQLAVKCRAVATLSDMSFLWNPVNLIHLSYQTQLLSQCSIWADTSIATLEAIICGELQILFYSILYIYCFCKNGTVTFPLWANWTLCDVTVCCSSQLMK